MPQTDGRRTIFDFISADNSQAELKIDMAGNDSLTDRVYHSIVMIPTWFVAYFEDISLIGSIALNSPLSKLFLQQIRVSYRIYTEANSRQSSLLSPAPPLRSPPQPPPPQAAQLIVVVVAAAADAVVVVVAAAAAAAAAVLVVVVVVVAAAAAAAAAVVVVAAAAAAAAVVAVY